MNAMSETAEPLVMTMSGINKSFGDFHVLKDCALDVPAGSTVVIAGPSGSGKSTLLRCVNLLEFVDRGSIIFEGQEVARERKRAFAIRRKMGMVFQSFELFPHLTVLENITLGPQHILGVDAKTARDEALALLERVKIPAKAEDYPESLSGGQQQRVAIARALAMKPRLMLYDEPTSALDPEMIKEVIDVMAELSEAGMTSIVVTHEMGFARRAADRIVFMEDGVIVEDAPTDVFFSSSANPRTRSFLEQLVH
ncbi:amino acid ABC transporter ATP-binding protein [Bosea lathyri]|uniref:Amino acid ABC transporter ATP-binding protein, PAAT family (TC 3.A.1.3.-) n=1 Tax=Bosea lathyri TaxID=1036778 RepID=A0A1H6DBB9_9HYPH|nr:amino acid ABC transporter ATP-binding protein [Bosea lathyri]SEG81786.1 amino acid ABC transporter ATP-binding protein, PAAT family (TC 3.A.1.3.-) [Bosea lathyri]